MRKIILASGSPRRKALLNQLIGADFEVVESTYEEDNTQAIPPKELVMKHSIEKGKDVATRCKEGIVISADTLVVLDNGVLGKPKTAERARETLEKISGREIHVISGITLIDIDNNKTITETEVTKVKMKEMTDEEIESYIATGEPLDKAGAFGVQDKGVIFVEKIGGCYNNIVGLPLFKLSCMLEKLGVNVLEQ